MNDGGCSCFWNQNECMKNEADCSGMGITSVAQCELNGGGTVAEGWSGSDTGSNWCNSCSCESHGMMICTMMACGQAPDCPIGAGLTVPDGWSGLGPDSCNTCTCSAGSLSCTAMACIADDAPWWNDDGAPTSRSAPFAHIGMALFIGTCVQLLSH
mmetsp:Transcript_14454/g.21286  ORF Transcript_14454/g.21286 Transcript_14454/m.21286 type:complete len:156 (+) Transcript_14454:86-553(+)